jgi:Tfp pilus assembly protein PilO
MSPEPISSGGSGTIRSRGSTAFPEQMKELFTALREGVILVVVVVILFWPGQIGRIAKEAGLKSAFGLEFYEQVQESQKQTEEAQAAMSEIQSELTQLGQQLQGLSRQQPGPALSANVRGLITRVDTLKVRSTTVNKSLQTNLQTQRKILERIPR